MARPVIAAAAAGTAASRSLPGRPGGRRGELDVARALVVAGLVVFHSAAVFAVGTSWFVNDPRPSTGFSVFMLWGSLWGMPLLFLVSGMGVRYAMRSRTAWSFAAERLGRLGIPFATGLVLLVPPMFYLEHLAQPGFHQPYGRFWLAFLNVPAIAAGLVPHGNWTSGGVGFDPAHLWFLYVLLVFSLALLPLFRYLTGPRGTRLAGRGPAPAGHAGRGGRAGDRDRGGVRPRHHHRRLGTASLRLPLLVRFLIASDARFEAALSGARWPALAAAAAATAGLLGWTAAAGPGTRATVAPCRRVRQPGRAPVLPAARTGHRGLCLDHRPLARSRPRQVPRPGGHVLHRHTCHLRTRRPPLPPHPPPIRHENPRAHRGPRPLQRGGAEP